MKGRNPRVREKARHCLATYGRFNFSIITRYEILRGLTAKAATRQLAAFEERCQNSDVLPLSDDIIVRAAHIYADLHRQGHLISDADILVAATALVQRLTLVTENVSHFSRVSRLSIESWRAG
jgi:tRNA(fMet)-specific endonuclease VapC